MKVIVLKTLHTSLHPPPPRFFYFNSPFAYPLFSSFLLLASVMSSGILSFALIVLPPLLILSSLFCSWLAFASPVFSPSLLLVYLFFPSFLRFYILVVSYRLPSFIFMICLPFVDFCVSPQDAMGDTRPSCA